MRLQLCAFAIAFLVFQAFASPIYERAAACPADKCFATVKLLPPLAKIASAFCSPYIKFTPTVTKISTATQTKVVTNTATTSVSSAGTTATQVQTVTQPEVTVSATCTTKLVPFQTVVNYKTYGAIEKRATTSTTAIPTTLAAGCGSGNALTSKISSACSCFLGTTKTVSGSATSTVTSTSVTSSTISLPGQTQTVTSVTVLDPVTVTACQTATSVEKGTCGVPVSTYTPGGRTTCSSDGAAPSETVAKFRIEGTSEGTIFDGCIAAGPDSITTPSGGTHQCDGTNNNAHPAPGGTLITAINEAAKLTGFDFDGTYSSQFSDFFINRIAGTTSTGNQFWGVLRNLAFTYRGGCQEYNSPGEGLWAFDAFRPNLVYLALSSDYAVVRPGDTVTLTVSGANPNSGALSPVADATMAGSTSGADGSLSFTAPLTPGCYQYKAERTNSVRSAAFYLTVM